MPKKVTLAQEAKKAATAAAKSVSVPPVGEVDELMEEEVVEVPVEKGKAKAAQGSDRFLFADLF